MSDYRAPSNPNPNVRVLTLSEVERLHALATLRALGGNMTKTATALGIDRRTLYRKIEKWGER